MATRLLVEAIQRAHITEVTVLFFGSQSRANHLPVLEELLHTDGLDPPPAVSLDVGFYATPLQRDDHVMLVRLHREQYLLDPSRATLFPLLHGMGGLGVGEFGTVFYRDAGEGTKYKAYSARPRAESQVKKHSDHSQKCQTVQVSLRRASETAS